MWSKQHLQVSAACSRNSAWLVSSSLSLLPEPPDDRDLAHPKDGDGCLNG